MSEELVSVKAQDRKLVAEYLTAKKAPKSSVTAALTGSSDKTPLLQLVAKARALAETEAETVVKELTESARTSNNSWFESHEKISTTLDQVSKDLAAWKQTANAYEKVLYNVDNYLRSGSWFGLRKALVKIVRPTLDKETAVD